MKKIFLFVIISCLFGAAKAATVSGTVTSVTSCGPVAGQKVFLRDSFFAYIDSAVTNSSGVYSITIPSSWPTPKPFLITISACGNVWNTTGHYSGSNVTINPFICGGTRALHGQIKLAGVPNSGGSAKVYLIKIQNNYPTSGDTTLTAVDSVIVGPTDAGNYRFVRACAPTDTFLVKALLMPGHANYSNYLPTYDSGSLNWSSAVRRTATSFVTSGGPYVDFSLTAGTNPGGPGFIGGSVLAGANKQTAVGDPLAARLLILTKSTGAPVAYTYSDAAGKFSFPSVAVGTYKLFGDAWGMSNPALTVNITATNSTVNNIIFEEHYVSNVFSGRFKTTGVGNVPNALAGVSVYPNPTTSFVVLTGMSTIKGSKTVVLCDIIGSVVVSKTFADGQPVEIATSMLPAGTYVLQVNTEVGALSFKVVK